MLVSRLLAASSGPLEAPLATARGNQWPDKRRAIALLALALSAATVLAACDSSTNWRSSFQHRTPSRTRAAIHSAMATVSAAIPADWRTGSVERDDLARFLFAPDDIIAVVGQDGLVANVAKYLDGQPVLGFNPEPGRNPGVLVKHSPDAAARLLAVVGKGTVSIENRTMVEIEADDGQRILALNEIYLGHASHQTARYTLRLNEKVERQASSGIIVATGTGATGWCRSTWLERHSALPLPEATDASLAWFVREAWPAPATGTTLTEGVCGDAPVEVTVESDHLVAFGDGIEADRLDLSWGQAVSARVADVRLRLVS